MRRSTLALVLLLLFSGLCQGEVPIISHVFDATAGQSVVQQTFDLWIDGPGLWSFGALAPDGLAFVDQEGQITGEGLLLSGTGFMQSSCLLEAHFDLHLLGEGTHTLGLQVGLEGAEGILGLAIASGYWILPLKSDRVRVEREGVGQLSLPSGQWFLLEEADAVFHGEQEAWLPRSDIETAELTAQVGSIELWWGSSSRLWQAGDRDKVTLYLRGPSPAGELVLRCAPHVRLGAHWSLDGQDLGCEQGSNGGWILHLPSLAEGDHELTGVVQTLLPPTSGQAEIQALWQGVEAFLPIMIGRSWFDYDGLQRIQVDTHSPLLLPSGRIRSTSGRGSVSVEDEGLNVVIPLDDPTKPIWVGTGIAESILWSPKHSGTRGDGEDFILPILLWDQGFSWRLVARSSPWLLDITGERQLFRGQFGQARVEISPQRMMLQKAPQSARSKDGWQWLEAIDHRKGTYSKGPWLWSVEVPREEGNFPLLGVQYSGERLRVRLTPKDVELKLSYDSWAWGARASTRTLWVETVRPDLRWELNRQGLAFHYKDEGDRGLKLNWDAQNTLQIQLEWKPWEAYLKIGSTDDSQAGLRYKRATSRDRFLFLTRGAVQVKRELILLETAGHLGYVLAPWCTLYIGGSWSTSLLPEDDLHRMDLRYEAGLVIEPLPQLVAAVSWSNDQGWQFKGGIVLPILGRKSQASCE
mgnify:FL=1